jgi:hypothetical protein
VSPRKSAKHFVDSFECAPLFIAAWNTLNPALRSSHALSQLAGGLQELNKFGAKRSLAGAKRTKGKPADASNEVVNFLQKLP